MAGHSYEGVVLLAARAYDADNAAAVRQRVAVVLAVAARLGERRGRGRWGCHIGYCIVLQKYRKKSKHANLCSQILRSAGKHPENDADG